MPLTVNGEPHALPLPCPVQALVERLKLNPAQVAVEHNGAIVPRSQYASALLSEGDTVEIVRFIGGG